MANGNYDLTFSLVAKDSAISTIPLANPLTNSPVAVSNGLFITTLDFGAEILTCTNAWLELGVRTNGSGAFTTLSPRQNLTRAPYAFHAAYADAFNGVLPVGALAGSYSNALAFNNAANSFAGNGAGLTGVNANTLDGLGGASFWQLGGNAGTTAGANFVGTTDNQPLELKVNGIQALRLEPASGTPNVIGGGPNNSVVGSVSDFIGGAGNSIQSNAFGSAIVGDTNNIINDGSFYSAICGGSNNIIGKALLSLWCWLLRLL